MEIKKNAKKTWVVFSEVSQAACTITVTSCLRTLEYGVHIVCGINNSLTIMLYNIYERFNEIESE